MAEKFDLEVLKRNYVASDERGDAKFAIDFHDMTIVLERLEQAEQAVQRVRELCRISEEHAQEYGDTASVYVDDLKLALRALDGDGRG